jgi:hypothetical protein
LRWTLTTRSRTEGANPAGPLEQPAKKQMLDTTNASKQDDIRVIRTFIYTDTVDRTIQLKPNSLARSSQ